MTVQADSFPGCPTRSFFLSLRFSLRRAEAELQALPIPNLYRYDRPPLLEEALNQSRERLMIIAPWIKADVVDKDFLEKLQALLKSNVAVFIGYGTNKQPTVSLAPNIRRPETGRVNSRANVRISVSRDWGQARESTY